MSTDHNFWRENQSGFSRTRWSLHLPPKLGQTGSQNRNWSCAPLMYNRHGWLPFITAGRDWNRDRLSRSKHGRARSTIFLTKTIEISAPDGKCYCWSKPHDKKRGLNKTRRNKETERNLQDDYQSRCHLNWKTRERVCVCVLPCLNVRD